jgi:ABC-type thiamin/hydroxymethylpyrimidine transport system permease subunit
MLSLSGASVLRFVGEVLQFGGLALGIFFAMAVIAAVLGPRPDGDKPPYSISGYETALAIRMLRRYSWRWVLLAGVMWTTGSWLLGLQH